MAEVSFDKAVEIVRQWGDLPAAHAEHYRTAPANRRPKLLAALIRDSAKERMAWDAVSRIAVRLLRDRERLPDELSLWLADTLREPRERPEEDLQERNRAIVKAVRLLVESYGFHPTRNGAISGRCCSEGGSACDVVGIACKLPVGYKAVERVWWGFTSWYGEEITEAEYRWLGWRLFDGPKEPGNK